MTTRFVLVPVVKWLMWCPDCQAEFVAVAGSEVQVCPKCRVAARAGGRQRHIPELDPADPSIPRIRFDAAHDRKFLNSRGSVRSPNRIRFPAITSAMSGVKSPAHLVAFGLFVFLLGQAILAWAFLTGHYTAWNVANIVSILGISMSFFGVSLSLRRFEQRIESLAKLVGRQLAGKPRRSRSKTAVKKQAGKVK